MAVERTPKVEGPQVREKTEMERWKETPSARAAEHVLDLYLSGQREEAERQLKAYQEQFGADAIDVPLPSRPAPRQLPGPAMMPAANDAGEPRRRFQPGHRSRIARPRFDLVSRSAVPARSRDSRATQTGARPDRATNPNWRWRAY